MCPLRHFIHNMFDMGYMEISCHHLPRLRKDRRIVNDHVITSQIQPELGGKTLNHLHGPLYNLDKGHEFSRRRVVADSKQLVTAFLASEDKRGAVIGTEYSFSQHVEGDARRRAIRHHANARASIRT